MKPDLYTKAVLTIIAITLTVIAFNQYLNPAALVQAQGGTFTGVQGSGQTFSHFFDTRSGDLWNYEWTEGGGLRVYSHAKIPKLGENGSWQNVSK